MAAKTLTPDELHQRLFVTPPEAAAILLWDVRTVRRLIHDGTIPATKADQQYRIPAAWVRERAALNGQPRPAGGPGRPRERAGGRLVPAARGAGRCGVIALASEYPGNRSDIILTSTS
jgi:excisionase family DNA binding protein